jgi:CHAD domain-containing protein
MKVGAKSKDKGPGKDKATEAVAPPSGPTFLVEASLVDTVVPKLDAWLDDLADAIPRVIHEVDSEAVHDLRVALRRIRSLLRVVRSVFGRFHVKMIRDDLKRVADATGSLRDEEVLVETIDALDLSEADREALGPWLARRGEQERSLRRSVIRMLESDCLEPPMKHLRALLHLPVRSGRDKEAHRFARNVVFVVQGQVEALRTADVDNVVAMHDLRIAFKRLRYAVEALGPVLPPELRAWRQVATKFQKVLGNLHDQDVAMDTVRAAADLPETTRDAVLEALARKRGQYADQYLASVGFEVVLVPEVLEEPVLEEQSEPEKAGTKKAGTKKAGTKKAGTKKAGTKKAGTKKAGT